MFDYKIVRIELKDKMTRKVPEKDYHEIIIEHGRLGYRLVHMFAPPLYMQGMADYIELVFEREY
jgi:hypothetical protein